MAGKVEGKGAEKGAAKGAVAGGASAVVAARLVGTELGARGVAVAPTMVVEVVGAAAGSPKGVAPRAGEGAPGGGAARAEASPSRSTQSFVTLLCARTPSGRKVTTQTPSPRFVLKGACR